MRGLGTGTCWAALTVLALAGCQKAPQPSQEALEPPPAVLAHTQQQLLLQTAMIALPPEGMTAADLPNPSSSEAILLATYCGQCHALPMPSMHSGGDWPSVVRRMWLRMDRLPDSLGLSVPHSGERVALLGYLEENALMVSGATLPAGTGREEFALICSRCHALPDPWIHSAEDWPAVFMRMERNMERMKVEAATPQEATHILTYLQSIGPRPQP